MRPGRLGVRWATNQRETIQVPRSPRRRDRRTSRTRARWALPGGPFAKAMPGLVPTFDHSLSPPVCRTILAFSREHPPERSEEGDRPLQRHVRQFLRKGH